MLKLVPSAVTDIADAAMQIQLLGTLLSNLEGMIYRCRADEYWTMEFVSKGCFALTGYSAEDLIMNSRISYEELTHPEDRLHVRKMIYEAMAGRLRYDIEYRIVRQDGEVRWVSERGAAVAPAGNSVVALEGFILDITERKQADEALRETERRYRSIFENAVEGIFQSTADGKYLAVNPALARMYGYDSPEQLIANLKDIQNQVYVDTRRRADFMRMMDKDGIVTNFESRVFQRDGGIIWISENARAVRNDEGELLFFEGTVEAITERKLHEAEIQFQATHDALTGLPNRTLLYDRLQQAVLNVQRYGNLVAVVFVDLDQFKYINDSLGHQIGDQLLRTVANRLKFCVRDCDTVARQGGDEFVLVLTNHVSEESITETMQRILLTVAKPWFVNGMELQVTCSMGVSLGPNDAQDAETLLKNADAAMFRAKELGRNNFQYFAAEMNSSVTDRLELLSSLRRAVACNDFVLHYQPKVNMLTRKLVGAEALVRWCSPHGVLVSPAQFIPLAEETGLILPIGEWVLRTACAQNVAWQRAGLPAVPISVNLSPRQLARENMVEMITRVLQSTGLAPHLLELEITENVVMRDVEKSFATLAKLKELGVKISIDDFGTGYSSLSYLKRFPVNTLKIDQTFVRDIATDQDNAGIVQAIISLGHVLKLNVLAEGVETEDQYRFLLANGCDEMQGYLVSRPVPDDEFSAILKRSAEAAGGLVWPLADCMV
jgi:diguanylate cyclase (GGDEF)-like protein/PAS domain S-box-containing protein